MLATRPTNLLLKRCGFSTSNGPECSTRRRIRGSGGVGGGWEVAGWESSHC